MPMVYRNAVLVRRGEKGFIALKAACGREYSSPT